MEFCVFSIENHIFAALFNREPKIAGDGTKGYPANA